MKGNIRGRSSDNADDGSRCNGTHSADTSKMNTYLIKVVGIDN